MVGGEASKRSADQKQSAANEYESTMEFLQIQPNNVQICKCFCSLARATPLLVYQSAERVRGGRGSTAARGIRVTFTRELLHVEVLKWLAEQAAGGTSCSNEVRLFAATLVPSSLRVRNGFF